MAYLDRMRKSRFEYGFRFNRQLNISPCQWFLEWCSNQSDICGRLFDTSVDCKAEGWSPPSATSRWETVFKLRQVDVQRRATFSLRKMYYDWCFNAPWSNRKNNNELSAFNLKVYFAFHITSHTKFFRSVPMDTPTGNEEADRKRYIRYLKRSKAI